MRGGDGMGWSDLVVFGNMRERERERRRFVRVRTDLTFPYICERDTQRQRKTLSIRIAHT